MKLTEASNGKRKSQWHNSRAVEEDKLKVMHYNILVCGVLIGVWPPLLIRSYWVLGYNINCLCTGMTLRRNRFSASILWLPENLLLG